MADLTSVDALLKEIWARRINTAFNQDIIGTARIERTSEGVRNDVSGRYVVVPVHVGRNHGIGSRPERGILPLPGQQSYVGARVSIKHQYGVGDITSQALDLADGDPKSFIATFDREMEGLVADFMKDYARQFYTTNVGTLGTVQSVSTNDITVDDVQYFEVGMFLDSVDTGTDTVVTANMEVTAVDDDTKVVTVDAAGATAANHVLVRNGNYQQEINGLADLVSDTGAIQNLDPAVDTAKWASHTLDMGGAFDEVQLVKAVDRVGRDVGATRNPISVFLTNDGGWRAAYAALLADRQFHNTVEFAFGVNAIPFNYKGRTIPIVADPDFPEELDAATTEYLGLTEEHVSIYRHPKAIHFADESGTVFVPATDRSDAYEFRARQFSQLGIELRNSHTRVTNVNTG